MRALVLCSVLLMCFCLLGQSQSPAFEVASIKQAVFESEGFFSGYSRAGACSRGAGLEISGNRVELSMATLCMLIQTAYDVQRYQMFGTPSWMMKADRSNYYNVAARAEGSSTLTPERARQMLQTLLADRFQLKLHRETRELPVYGLVVRNNTPKFTTDPQGPCAKMPGAGFLVGMIRGGQMMASCKPVAIAEFAEKLAFTVGTDRPIVDRTGLTGQYVFELHWASDSAPIEPDSPPTLFTAVQEQLGLRLESQKAPFEVLVIDHAEPPTPN